MASSLYLILVTDPVPWGHGCACGLGSNSQFFPPRDPGARIKCIGLISLISLDYSQGLFLGLFHRQLVEGFIQCIWRFICTELAGATLDRMRSSRIG